MRILRDVANVVLAILFVLVVSYATTKLCLWLGLPLE